jgi:hypothetical protein
MCSALSVQLSSIDFPRGLATFVHRGALQPSRCHCRALTTLYSVQCSPLSYLTLGRRPTNQSQKRRMAAKRQIITSKIAFGIRFFFLLMGSGNIGMGKRGVNINRLKKDLIIFQDRKDSRNSLQST